MIEIDPKLLKIIALAKNGIGGEKDSAIALVKKICEREGLDFEEVMSERSEFREFDLLDIKWRNKLEKQIVINVIYKYALSTEHATCRLYDFDKSARYTTTPSKHLETANAIQVYLQAYRKELKRIQEDIMSAFLDKHEIFPEWELPSDQKKKQKKEKVDFKRMMRIAGIAEGMEDVEIQRQIGSGN